MKVCRIVFFICVLLKTHAVLAQCDFGTNFVYNTNIKLGEVITFKNTTPVQATFEWQVNGILVSREKDLIYTFLRSGQHYVTVTAFNGSCKQSYGVRFIVPQSCLRTTFQKTFGSSGDEQIFDAIKMPEGGSITVGSQRNSSGIEKALIMATDINGKTIWSHTIASSKNERCVKIINTSRNTYLIIGNSIENSTGISIPFILEINKNGDFLRSKQIAISQNQVSLSSSLKDIVEYGSNTFVICGTTTNGTKKDLLFIALDSVWNILKKQVYDYGSEEESVGFLGLDNPTCSFAMVSNGTYNGMASLIISPVYTNLEVGQTRILNNTKKHIVGTGISYRNAIERLTEDPFYYDNNTPDYTVLTGYTYDTDSEQRSFFDIIYDKSFTTPLYAQQYTTELMITALESVLVANEKIVHVGTNGKGQVLAFTTASTGNIEWAKKYTWNDSSVIRKAIMAGDESFLYILESVNSNQKDIKFLKTALSGETSRSGQCDYEESSVSTTNFDLNFAYNIPSTRLAVDVVRTDLAESFIQGNLKETVICSQNICIPTAGTALECDKYFTRNYASNITNIGAAVYHTMYCANGEIISIGLRDAGNVYSSGLIIRMSPSGNVLWTKSFGVDKQQKIRFENISELPNGDFIISGLISGKTVDYVGPSKILVLKVSKSGEMIWTKQISLSDGTFERFCKSKSHTIGSNGDIFINAETHHRYYNGQHLYYFALLKLTSEGTTQWAKEYLVNTPDSASSQFLIGNLTEANGMLIGAGDHVLGNQSLNKIFLKINPNNGNLIWGKAFNESKNYGIRIKKINEHLIVHYSTPGETLFSKIDTSGEFLKSVKLYYPQVNAAQLEATAKNIYIYTQSSRLQYLLKMDVEGAIDWSRRFKNTLTSPLQSNLSISPSHDILLRQTRGVFNIRTYDSTGLRRACLNYDGLAVVRTEITNQPSPVSVPILIRNLIFSSDDAEQPVNNLLSLQSGISDGCPYNYETSACSSIEVDTPDSMCLPDIPITLIAKRAANCNATIEWKMDKSSIKIISSTDSSITIIPINNVNTKISAELQGACQETKKEFTLKFKNPPKLDLGNNLSFCDTLSIEAHEGFSDYKWSHGMIGRKAIFTEPGRYILTAIDECNAIVSDTVVLTRLENCNINNKRVFLFPNPSRDALSIKFLNYKNENALIEVFSSLGQKVTSEMIPISETSYTRIKKHQYLAAGIYFIKVTFQNNPKDSKVLKWINL